MPSTLNQLIDRLVYKPGWVFELADRDHLHITIPTYDSATHAPRTVEHVFGVPHDVKSGADWLRWLRARVVDVELHEVGEFFQVDGQRPFYPFHGRQGDPYASVDRLGPDRTSGGDILG